MIQTLLELRRAPYIGERAAWWIREDVIAVGTIVDIRTVTPEGGPAPIRSGADEAMSNRPLVFQTADNILEFQDDDRDGFMLRILRGNDGDFHLSMIPDLVSMLRDGMTDEEIAFYNPLYNAHIRVRSPMIGGGDHEALYSELSDLWKQAKPGPAGRESVVAPTSMSTEEHRLRHRLLHTRLDELVADFIRHTDGRPSSTTVMDLMKWSHQQTIQPTEEAAKTPGESVPETSLNEKDAPQAPVNPSDSSLTT